MFGQWRLALHWGRAHRPACCCRCLRLSFRHNPLVEQEGISVASGKCLRCLSNGVPRGMLPLRPLWSHPSSNALKGRTQRQMCSKQLFRGAFLQCSPRNVPTKSVGIPWSEVCEVCCPLGCPASAWLTRVTSITHGCSRFPHEASLLCCWLLCFGGRSPSVKKTEDSKLLLIWIPCKVSKLKSAAEIPRWKKNGTLWGFF